MLDRWLELCVRAVLFRRRLVLVLCAVAVAAALAAVPSLRRNPSPQALLDSATPELSRAQQDFARRFEGSEEAIVAVVTAPSGLLTRAMLGYVFELTQLVTSLPHVERVESLTKTPLRHEDQSTAALDLDSLAAEKDIPSVDPELLSALSDVVTAVPARFPMGLMSLAERAGSTSYAPIIISASPSEADVRAVEVGLGETPILLGRLVGQHKKHALVALFLAPGTDDIAATELIQRIEAWARQHPPPEGGSVRLGGLPQVNASIADHMIRDQRVLIPGTLLVSLLVMFASLRWWAGVLLPLVQVGVTSLCVLGGMALFGLELNVITNILPAFLIILGLSDSIHLVHRYMEELAITGDSRESIARTIRAIGRACFGTASTTVAGLFALGMCQTRMLAQFGIVAGFGVLLAYISTLFLLPALLLGKRPPVREGAKDGQSAHNAVVRALVVWTTWIIRRPLPVLAFALSLTAYAWYAGSTGVVVDSALLDQFHRKDPVFETTMLLEREFEGVRPLEVSLSADAEGAFLLPERLEKLDELARWVEKRDGVLSVLTPVDVLTQLWTTLSGEGARAEALGSKEAVAALRKLLVRQSPSPLDPFLTRDGKNARVRIRLTDMGSQRTLQLTRELEQQLKVTFAADPAVRYAVLGDAYTSSLGLTAVVSDLTGSMISALVTIFLLIVLSFRSLRYGLLSMVPGVMPLALTLGWMDVRGIKLNAATAIIFSVSLGITVDGAIHMLARLREELTASPLLTPAMVRTVRGSGEALLLACGALTLGFGVLLLSSFVPVQRFAELIAVSIASCVFSTLVVLPALIKVLGRRFMLA